MIAYCSFQPDPIWVREAENGIRHITLRRNFTQVATQNADGGTPEQQFQFEETDIYITDRDSIENFISANFEALFTQGLQQTADKQVTDEKIQRAQQLINDGSIVDNLQQIGQQITDIILGV